MRHFSATAAGASSHERWTPRRIAKRRIKKGRSGTRAAFQFSAAMVSTSLLAPRLWLMYCLSVTGIHFFISSRNGRSLWAVTALGGRGSCAKGEHSHEHGRKIPASRLEPASNWRRLPQNPKTGASLLSLADYWVRRADECAARAQSISDPERHADMLRFAGMWLSLTEPIKDELRGAHELPPQRAA
jgi:hypothetical protein